MLKVLINCPGGWSHGLDSPERGEGRWAQNLARCLARSGKYAVSACSGGEPTWGRGDRIAGITLLSESGARARGPYDAYFDAAWYRDKRPAAEAVRNFHVHFGYEPRLGERLPDGHYLVYVLRASRASYFGEGRSNADRTFYLPAPFGDAMRSPDPSRRRVVSTMRGSDATGRSARFAQLYEAVSRLRREHPVPLTWISSPGLESSRDLQDRVLTPIGPWGIPYNEIRAELSGCGVNAALDGWSSVLDATVMGVPSLAWTGGIDATACRVAEAYGLLLPDGSTADRLADVVGRLFCDERLYVDYVRDLQAEFADHVAPITLALFDEIVRIT